MEAAVGTPAAPAATGVSAPAAPDTGGTPAAGDVAGAQAGQDGIAAGAPASTPEGDEPGGQPGGQPIGDFSERELAFLTALKDERGKRQDSDTEIQTLRTELEELKSRQASPAPAQPAASPSAPADPFSGIEDDSIMTGADVKSLIQSGIMPMFQQLAGALTMIQRGQQHPDMNEAISTYLPQVLKTDPALSQALKQVTGPARMIIAHALGSLAKRAVGPAPAIPPGNPGGGGDDLSTLAAQILANMGKPSPAGAAAGSPINTLVEQLRDMDTPTFLKYKEDQKRRWAAEGR